MIKKTKINFTVTVLVTNLVILAFCYLVTLFIINQNNIKYIGNELTSCVTYYEDNLTFDRNNLLVLSVDGEPLILNGETFFSVEVQRSIVQKSSEVSSGQIGNVFYKTATVNDTTLVFALDMTIFLSQNNASNINLLVLFAFVYLVCSVTLIISSNKILNTMQTLSYKQKQFISDVSHELKTPLTIISANADVLSNTVKSKYLTSIKQQSDRLGYLINDMITLAKLDEEKAEIIKENFSLTNALNESVLPFEEVAFEYGKTLLTDIAENVEYYGDRESIIKIMEILIDNAIKYSSKSANIKVALKNLSSKYVITVYNDGSGIKEEDSSKIFERFYRGDYARSRENGGSGLGLSIAKSLCDVNGWTISADSKYNESMTITLVL